MAGTQQFVMIGGRRFRTVAKIDEGLNLNFLAGPIIAVEKFDMRPGGTEFDFQVNSRAVHGNRPIDIVSTRAALNREFIENRVKTNIAGLPISVGNGVAIATGKAPPQATYGELQPQLFRSNAGTDPVGWRIVFTRAHYTGSGGKLPIRARSGGEGRIPNGVTMRPPVGVDRIKEAGRATTHANASGSAGLASPPVAAGQANGRINPLGVGATLRLYVQAEHVFRPLSRPIGSGDMIGTDPSIFDRLMSVFR